MEFSFLWCFTETILSKNCPECLMFHFSCQRRGDLLLETVGMFFDETVVDPYTLVNPMVCMDVDDSSAGL